MNQLNNNENRQSQFALRLWLAITCYLLLNAIIQLLVSPTANLDQSEQLMLSQALRWGYTSQPPLYTWLVYIIFQVTGPSLAALLIFKAGLLSLIAGCLLKTGSYLKFSRQQYLISMAGLALIPQFIWESQRDLTHSTLVTALAALSLVQLIRLRHHPELVNYLLIGALIGLGMLSKYNYSLFALSLLLATFSTAAYRDLLLNWKTLPTLLIALFLFAPHAHWAANNMDIASESVNKLTISSDLALSGLLAPFYKAAAFLAPFWLFVLFFLLKKRVKPLKPPVECQLLLRLLISVAIIVILFVVLTGTQSFKDRWYQPLLFFTPLLLATYAYDHSWYQRKLYKFYIGSALFLTVLTSIILPSHIVLAEKIDKISRPNHPYQSLGKSLRVDLEQQPGSIITNNRLPGGNLRLTYPDTLIVSPDNYQISPANLSEPVLLLCENNGCADKSFIAWSTKYLKQLPAQKHTTKIVAPYYYYPQKNHTFHGTWTEKK